MCNDIIITASRNTLSQQDFLSYLRRCIIFAINVHHLAILHAERDPRALGIWSSNGSGAKRRVPKRLLECCDVFRFFIFQFGGGCTFIEVLHDVCFGETNS